MEIENQSKPALIIIGAGQTGRELARRLGYEWHILIIDFDERKLDLIEDDSHITKIKGDATSEFFLKKLDFQGSNFLILATGDDDVNLEIAKIAKKLGLMRIIAVSKNAGRNDEYRKLDVDVINRSETTAGIITSKIKKGKVIPTGIGLGKGEILEITVLPGSVVEGKTLKELKPKKWLVGAIYRKGELIVPHGDTTIKVGDKLVLIGEPDIVGVIAELIRTGAPEFPLQYGSNLLAYTRGKHNILDEIKYIAENSRVYELRIAGTSVDDFEKIEQDFKNIRRKVSYVPEVQIGSKLRKVIEYQDIGLLVLPPLNLSFLEVLGLKKSLIAKVLDYTEIPTLFSRGTHPYNEITLFLTDPQYVRGEAELAIDLARSFKSRLTIATVTPHEVFMEKELKMETEHLLSEALKISLMHNVKVKEVCLEGNPIEEMVKFSETQNLVIFGHRKGRRNSIFFPDVSLHLAAKLKCSLVVITHGNK